MEHHGYTKIALADPLRSFIASITGLTHEELTDSDLKEQPLDWLNGTSPRRMMQTLGTEWGRELIDPELWLKVARRQIEAAKRRGAPGVVIPDIRFDNEAEMVRQLGGTIVQLVRPGASTVADHPSEDGIPESLIDLTIRNDKGRAHLASWAETLALN